MKRNFFLSMLGGFFGAAILILLLSVVGLAGAQGRLSISSSSDLAAVSSINALASTDISSTFTYQGQLKSAGTSITRSCSMAFRLYNDSAAGSQVANPITLTTVPITNGLFTVGLNFGDNVFTGTAFWLGLMVNCGSGYVALSPRQQLTVVPYALHAIDAWSINGNGGTNANTKFLGTTDDVSLTIRVSNTTAYRIIPAVDPSTGFAPNISGGSAANTIAPSVYGATIGGGGVNAFPNRIIGTGNYATIGGGLYNTANDQVTTVGGGFENTASNGYATIGGGYANTASGLEATVSGGSNNLAGQDYAAVAGGYGNTASNQYATISGGFNNTASNKHTIIGGGEDNTASGDLATIGGGQSNIASGDGAFVGGGGYNGQLLSVNGNAAQAIASTIGGGYGNVISHTASYAFIGGGYENIISGSLATVGGGGDNFVNSSDATIGGGINNIASAVEATVGGGYHNTASDQATTIGGGYNNNASNVWATIGGGTGNLASGSEATVGGGIYNTASGIKSTVPGGDSNTASGKWSFAAGYNAHAYHDGAFVWSDSTGLADSTANDQFLVHAQGGIYLYPLSGGCILSTGAGGWSCSSDRNLKENFTPVDTAAVLRALSQIPVLRWNSKGQTTSIQHIGPMAQDFYAAFNVGDDNLHINTVDAQGVALAAIQGLYQENQDLKARVSQLEQTQSPAPFNPFNLISVVALIGFGVMGIQQSKQQKGDR